MSPEHGSQERVSSLSSARTHDSRPPRETLSSQQSTVSPQYPQQPAVSEFVSYSNQKGQQAPALDSYMISSTIGPWASFQVRDRSFYTERDPAASDPGLGRPSLEALPDNRTAFVPDYHNHLAFLSQESILLNTPSNTVLASAASVSLGINTLAPTQCLLPFPTAWNNSVQSNLAASANTRLYGMVNPCNGLTHPRTRRLGRPTFGFCSNHEQPVVCYARPVEHIWSSGL